ncbi:hypothetical protein HYY72_04195 [Candidatus Woesearchaeota archaeon]|nr:hypothetical protein [Candidatus Woesearchaeota archaeon]
MNIYIYVPMQQASPQLVKMQQNTQNMLSDGSQASDAIRGVRTLEERYSNLVRRVQITEQNMLSSSKKSHAEFKAISSEIMELKKQVQEINDKLALIVKELQTLSKKEEVDVLKKYLNLWEPVNFVTQNEVEKIVKRAVDEQAK